jgi:tetratricopeptide (TPR) repeat protein
MADDEFGSRRELAGYYERRAESRQWAQREINYTNRQTRHRANMNALDLQISNGRATTSAITPAQSSPTGPSNSATAVESAKAHYINGDYRKALQAAETFAAQGMSSPELDLLMADCNLELNCPAAALAILTHAIEASRGSSTLRYLRGEALEMLGRVSEAADDFDTAARLAPRSVEYCTRAAFALHRSEQYSRAIPYFNQAEELGVDDVHLYAARGHCFEQLNELERSYEDYDRAARYEPHEWFHYARRGRLALALGQRERASADFSKVLQLAPDQPDGYRYRALWSMMSGHYANARQALLTARELAPRDADTHLALGDCAMKLNDGKAALDSFREAEGLFEQDGDTRGVAAVSARIRQLLSGS